MADKNVTARPSIRQLHPNDAEAWASLRQEALEAHPLTFGSSVPDDPKSLIESALVRLASSEESAIFGAFAGTRLIGIVGVYRESGKKERHESFIWGMYVTAGERRQGAGESLLGTAVDKARSWLGVEQVHLSVSDVADDARRMYQRHGFREWGKEPRALRWEGRTADETHMLLDLRESGAAQQYPAPSA